MSIDFSRSIGEKLKLNINSVSSVLALLNEGATIPFIARYRKDQTGALDEVQIQQIQEEAKFLKEFSERKAFIEKTISEQDKMTEEIQKMLDEASTLNELEDIYLPYKPKRKTRAQKAREQGLEPLALWILEQNTGDLSEQAKNYITEEVADENAALLGARYILAELINENAELRTKIRSLFEKEASVNSTVIEGKEEAGQKYKDYFEFSEPVHKIPSHRILAILRGFMEEILRMTILPDEETALEIMEKIYVTADNEAGLFVKKAVKDAYKKMLQPSLESEFRMLLKTRADEEAINVFSENLRQLLLSSPLGNKKILAIDPGYRTGCKVVVINENGELQETGLIYVHEKNHRLIQAEELIRKLVDQYKIESFAIGDGTAGRETEQFIKGLQLNIPVFLVNEDGASIYSGSPIGREEFPDQDITIRGAVSIGRRLMDPLAELVKIDPKSIGVGQYQHDVNQVRLKEKLDQTVESCVNTVGVNLNTAGKYLLKYVSGIGSSLADNIVKYRSENGPFKNRKALLKVSKLGPKAFEQCAGFLRIKEGEHVLDSSGVHPESYKIVEQIAQDLNVSIAELIGNSELLNKIPISKYITEDIGKHTIEDIIKELKKPGLDPRSEVETFEFASIFAIEDVHEGMVVPGIVTNLTRFGAFVDIGVKQDGLVHVSEIANYFIADPSEVLKLNQQVKVKVVEVDIARKRIALSIKQAEEPGLKKEKRPSMKKNAPKKESQSGSMADALAALKGKFK